MKRVFFLIGALVFSVLFGGIILPLRAADGGSDASVAVLSKPSASARAEAFRLRAAGIESALEGKFSDAIKRFRQVGQVLPEDAAGKRALQLLTAHVVKCRQDEAARLADYKAAVRRMNQCMLAQKHMDNPAHTKQKKKLRKRVQDAISVFGDAPSSKSVELAAPDELAGLKAKAVKAIGKAITGLKKSAAMMKKDKSLYATTFRAAVKQAVDDLNAHRKIWKGVLCKTPKERHDGARKLYMGQEALADSLAEVEAMVVSKPWRFAMTYGRLARILALDSDNVSAKPWYRKLVADIEARGKDAVKCARWNDALSAYIGLKDLCPDNENYKELAKIVTRHVRVLRLYGKGNGSDDDEKESATTKPVEKGEQTWKDLVSRVDKDMIKKVITSLSRYYVSSVDYRKVIRGALMSVRVLVETPQAAEAFTRLGNKTELKKMLDEIDKVLKDVEKRNRVDQLDLNLALNQVLNASERTVKIPVDVLSVEFADGVLNELDRFSSMVWPYEVENFNKNTMGRFFGVGIQISKDPNGPLKVSTPLAGSPAFKAGIKTGDTILAVDPGTGMQTTSELTINACVKMITGKKGTKVVLRIKRRGFGEHFDVAVVRDEIRIHTVEGWRRLSGGGWDYVIDPADKIGYLRIKQFTDTTAGDMVKVLKSLRKAGVRSVMLDLRGNPGGLLRAATAVVNQYVRKGQIVCTRGRGGRLRSEPAMANDTGVYLDGDLVILIDQYSASAAEIVSGAMKELHRAVIVGRRSYGKGSVQNVIPIMPFANRPFMKPRAFLKLTTAYYYVGDNEKIVHRKNGEKDWGVQPNVEIRNTPRKNLRCMTLRRKTEVIHDVPPNELEDDLAEQYNADIQLRTGVLLLKLMQLKNDKRQTVISNR